MSVESEVRPDTLLGALPFQTQQTVAARVIALQVVRLREGGGSVAEVLLYGQIKCRFGSPSVGDEIGDSVSCWKPPN